MKHVSNPFEAEGEAAKYHKYRPRYHAIAFGMIHEFLKKNFDYSVDVACGTGHSTVALSKISKKVVGCDQSEAMLQEARANSKIEYIKADAENLPFDGQAFDFLNISMGFHWLDQEKFLREAKRVLKRQGLIAIGGYGFTGKISGDPEKQRLHHNLFEEYLPSASRKDFHPSAHLAAITGLDLVKEMKYENFVSMNAGEFINLIMTWSNFQILNENRKAVALSKMREVFDQIFAGQNMELPFAGRTVLYRFL